MPPETQQNIRELTNRLKAFGVIFKIGREMSEAQDFSSAAAIAVNSTEILLHFRRSAIVECSGSSFSLAAQYAQVVPNGHSELAGFQLDICRELDLEPGKSCLLQLGENSYSGRFNAALGELLQDDDGLIAIALPEPGFARGNGSRFIWLLEFSGTPANYVMPTVNLLAGGIGDALYAHKYCRNISAAKRLTRGVSRFRILLGVLAVVLVAMFIPVSEQVNAEFVLRAPEITGAYALFDGPIAECRKQDGERVKKGDVIAVYDTSQLRFRLDSARNRLAEAEKEYELENTASFSDRSRLGKVPLLAAKVDSAAVDVKEAKWYLAHSEIKAPADGILALADGRAELLRNRVVRTGDRLFDIYGGKGMSAEIRVDEKDSSILLGNITVRLFLYTQPEKAIRTRITDVRQYPEITEQNTWCYKVLADLQSDMPLRYGMRGIAKISGKKVSLGYFLFKNAVLYFRWL